MPEHAIGIDTPTGRFTARFSDLGLSQLDFPRAAARGGATPGPEQLPAKIRGWVQTTRRALEAALAGRSARALPPLDLAAGTPFQQQVWAALRQIPCGQTRTYGQIATAMGRPQAARAVGGACGANPVPVLIPCHRAVAAGGGLGGFSGGLRWKRLLLGTEREAARSDREAAR